MGMQTWISFCSRAGLLVKYACFKGTVISIRIALFIILGIAVVCVCGKAKLMHFSRWRSTTLLFTHLETCITSVRLSIDSERYIVLLCVYTLS